jgi:hypothetical protein
VGFKNSSFCEPAGLFEKPVCKEDIKAEIKLNSFHRNHTSIEILKRQLKDYLLLFARYYAPAVEVLSGSVITVETVR